MEPFKLLVVEDDARDMKTCMDSLVIYQHKKQRKIEIVKCKNVEEAFHKLDNSFDGAIVDLKLASQGGEGNRVIKRIVESYFRIPIAIFTATPGSEDSSFSNIGVFKKGETSYEALFDALWAIHETGLTRIMGGRGVIEKALNDVFIKNILPQKQAWIKYGGSDPSRTEKALLRHTLNHLLQLLDDDRDRCFPEEVYIHPPISDDIRTGSIVKKKDDNRCFVVLNPACDLVIRSNGIFKTDRVLLVEIEEMQAVLDAALENITKKDKRANKLRDVLGNNHNDYHHWLPKADFFQGGFLNFRKVTALTKGSFTEAYYSPETQISPAFVKDIVARFSSYYSRQGQPDIENESIILQLIS